MHRWFKPKIGHGFVHGKKGLEWEQAAIIALTVGSIVLFLIIFGRQILGK